MRTTPRWFLAASLVAGMSLTAPAPRHVSAADTAADNERASSKLALPAGFEEKDVHAERGVKSGLAKLTERFATKGDYKKYLAEFAKPNEERLLAFTNFDQAKLDGRIDQINKAWQTKYGKDFDLSDKNVVFDGRYPLVQGEVADPAVALEHWPVPVTTNTGAITASEKQRRDKDSKDVKREAKADKLDKGRNAAIVRFPAAFRMPEMDVSMIHQLPIFWRVYIPLDRTGEDVYNDVLNHLTWIGEHVDQWPSDVTDGYRMVAHHAVAAAYGVDVPGKSSSSN